MKIYFEANGNYTRIVKNMKKLRQANITLGAIQSRLSSLDSYWAKFEEQHKVFRTVHKDAIKSTDDIKKDVDIVEEPTSKRAICLTTQLVSHIKASRLNPLRQEPTHQPLEPRCRGFSGKYEDWPAFRDLFQSIIGKDGSLSEVEKLHYLKVSVKADAESLIKNLPTTTENFNRVWIILCEHFEKIRDY